MDTSCTITCSEVTHGDIFWRNQPAPPRILITVAKDDAACSPNQLTVVETLLILAALTVGNKMHAHATAYRNLIFKR